MFLGTLDMPTKRSKIFISAEKKNGKKVDAENIEEIVIFTVCLVAQANIVVYDSWLHESCFNLHVLQFQNIL